MACHSSAAVSGLITSFDLGRLVALWQTLSTASTVDVLSALFIQAECWFLFFKKKKKRKIHHWHVDCCISNLAAIFDVFRIHQVYVSQVQKWKKEPTQQVLQVLLISVHSQLMIALVSVRQWWTRATLEDSSRPEWLCACPVSTWPRRRPVQPLHRRQLKRIMRSKSIQAWARMHRRPPACSGRIIQPPPIWWRPLTSTANSCSSWRRMPSRLKVTGATKRNYLVSVRNAHFPLPHRTQRGFAWNSLIRTQRGRYLTLNSWLNFNSIQTCLIWFDSSWNSL